MFSHLINSSEQEEVARHVLGIILDIVINTTAITGTTSKIYDNVITVTDIKTLAPGTSYTNINNSVSNQAVNVRALQVHRDYYCQARIIDRKFNNIKAGAPGPVEKGTIQLWHLWGSRWISIWSIWRLLIVGTRSYRLIM